MTNNNGHHDEPLRAADAHVCEVVRSAERELRQLLQQRGEIVKRIGTIKQTLAGLARLFGESVLTDELLTLLDRGAAQRRSGLTRACRLVLMDAPAPASARQVCDQVRRRFPELLEHHKDPLASINTVLGRLEQYAEARRFQQDDGRRVWEWVSERSGVREAEVAPAAAPEALQRL
jgi:chorismate mutase